MSTQKYNLLILAGGEKGPLSDEGDYSSKAMIPIHGRTMIERVLDVYHSSNWIDNIVVVGPDELEQSETVKKKSTRIRSAGTLIQNLLLGIGHIKANVYHYAKDHQGYLISFCDAVFINQKMIDETIQNIDSVDADVVLHYVEKSSFEKDGLTAKRTYIPVDGKLYTGSVVYYIRRFSMVMNLLVKLSKLRKIRKNPEALLEIIGAKDNSIAAIESALSEYIQGKVKILVSTHSGLGMDVDKPSDLELAKLILD